MYIVYILYIYTKVHIRSTIRFTIRYTLRFTIRYTLRFTIMFTLRFNGSTIRFKNRVS